MPWSGSVDAWTRVQITKYDMCKKPEGVIQEDWINFFIGAIRMDSLALSNINHIM